MRRAETLIEFLIAMAVFATIMTGVFDFIANQMENITKIKDRDFFMYYTEKWLISPDNYVKTLDKLYELKEKKLPFIVTLGTLSTERGSIDFKCVGLADNLIVTDNKNSMTFHVSFDAAK